MKKRLAIAWTIIAVPLLLGAGASAAEKKSAATPLFDSIAALDAAVFDAFNQCGDPSQLQKHTDYFDPEVEFYHDNGGVTWGRDSMISNTKKYVCGKFSREIIPGTLQVFPIKDFGAIAQGSHRFCQFDTKSCDGIADFVMIWANQDGAWKITRVLSYGHRAAN
jgi:hypothetical protein